MCWSLRVLWKAREILYDPVRKGADARPWTLNAWPERMTAQVDIYTTPYCGYCRMAKQLLAR